MWEGKNPKNAKLTHFWCAPSQGEPPQVTPAPGFHQTLVKQIFCKDCLTSMAYVEDVLNGQIDFIFVID